MDNLGSFELLEKRIRLRRGTRGDVSSNETSDKGQGTAIKVRKMRLSSAFTAFFCFFCLFYIADYNSVLFRVLGSDRAALREGVWDVLKFDVVYALCFGALASIFILGKDFFLKKSFYFNLLIIFACLSFVFWHMGRITLSVHSV
ncbi:MAG: hypothetical protein LBL72_08130 [Candidatus Accumulibacter sp.]|nr:hypothetical protein [Accumulibacter sp.]